MRVHPADQNSAAWILARLGIPTASQFDRIITPSKRKYSESRGSYINELVAERIKGEQLRDVSTVAMSRGSELEDDARAWYEFHHDADTVTVGLCLHDEYDAGASPDALVGDDGGLEIKCPELVKHIANLRGAEIAKPTQVQGGMWVTGREWWDVTSHHPGMRHVVRRFERDPEWMGLFDEYIPRFLKELEAAYEAVIGGESELAALMRASLTGEAA